METNALLETKRQNLLKVMSRQEGDFVPNMIAASCATVAWTGQKVTDIIHQPEVYVKAMTDVFGEMWADGSIFMASLFTPKLEQFFDPVQNKFGPDGVTPEHLQLSPMKPEEYDKLIADPDRMGGVIVLTEGKYHQIKRMLEAIGNRITRLERISFGTIPLDSSLSRGSFRELSTQEIQILEKQK